MRNLKRANALPLPQKTPHEHHQKPRNAPARYLLDSRRNHSAVPHHHPDHHNGNPGVGSGHFDSHRQIGTPLTLTVLVFGTSLRTTAIRRNRAPPMHHRERPETGFYSYDRIG
jgi:hypothetical protein